MLKKGNPDGDITCSSGQDLIRGVPLHVCLSGLGRNWTRDGSHHFSRVTSKIDVFISHEPWLHHIAQALSLQEAMCFNWLAEAKNRRPCLSLNYILQLLHTTYYILHATYYILHTTHKTLHSTCYTLHTTHYIHTT